MKTQNNTLNFNKAAILELGNNKLSQIKGGSISYVDAIGSFSIREKAK